MKLKPVHLGLKVAEQFKDTSVVDVYHYRPPYPDEAIRILVGLIADEPRTILDVGCGIGDLSRRLVDEVECIDAIDFSLAMINKGKQLPEGDHTHLNWIYGRVEEAAYALPTHLSPLVRACTGWNGISFCLYFIEAWHHMGILQLWNEQSSVIPGMMACKYLLISFPPIASIIHTISLKSWKSVTSSRGMG